jgi:hypothetical protein
LKEGKDKGQRPTLVGQAGLVSEDFEDLFAALFLLEKAIIHLIILGFANQNMPGSGDKAVVYPPGTA